MNKKERIISITVIVYLTIALVAVFFGRIYFPENFMPNDVSFFENYLVLVLGGLLTISGAAFLIGVLLYVTFYNKITK